MSWEPAPERSRDRRLLSAVLALVALAGAAALAFSSDRATLPVIESAGSGGTRTGQVAGRSAFRPEPLGPIEASRGRRGAGPLLPDAADLTIVIADLDSRLQAIDVASGDVDVVQVFADARRGRPRGMLVVGDRLVLDANNGPVVALRGDLTQPVVLARRHRAIPSADTGSVWVYDGAVTTLGGVATRLAFDGTVLDRAELPALARPVAGTTDGLLVATPGTVSRIAADGSVREVARGQAIASDGRRLARLDCAGDLSCAVVLGTVANPDGARAQLRPDDVPLGLYDLPRAHFSPDGRWLALPITETRRDRRIERSRVAVIDVAFGAEAARIDGSPLTHADTPLAWSPDSRWLVVSTGTGLQAWSTTDHSVIELGIRVSPTYAVAVH